MVDPKKISWKLGEILVQKGYISWDQLEEALTSQKENEETLAHILSSKGFIPKKLGQNLFLGEILLRKKWLKWEDLKFCLQEQQKTGRLLGEILLEGRFVSERNLYHALAIQHGLRFAELDKVTIQPDIARKIPDHVVKDLGFMPLVESRGEMLIAISDPMNVQIEDELRRRFPGYEIHTTVATPSDIRNAIERFYSR